MSRLMFALPLLIALVACGPSPTPTLHTSAPTATANLVATATRAAELVILATAQAPTATPAATATSAPPATVTPAPTAPVATTLPTATTAPPPTAAPAATATPTMPPGQGPPVGAPPGIGITPSATTNPTVAAIVGTQRAATQTARLTACGKLRDEYAKKSAVFDQTKAPDILLAELMTMNGLADCRSFGASALCNTWRAQIATCQGG